MLPQQRNEAKIEDAISRVRKVLNAAENSNQAGEDLIVPMSRGDELYDALNTLVRRTPFQPTKDGIAMHLTFAQVEALKAVLSKVEGE